jgi:hypothetical protein
MPEPRSNDYSPGLRRLPEDRLREYILNPEDFHEDAILAAIWELGRRRPLSEDEIRLESEINQKLNQNNQGTIESPLLESKVIEISVPTLYSVVSIMVFSVLFSVIAGGIMMFVNFRRTGHKAESFKVLGFSLLFTLVSVIILSFAGSTSPVISVILNILGGYLIEQLFWNRVLGPGFLFYKQEVWTALLVALLAISPLVWFLIQSGAFENM